MQRTSEDRQRRAGGLLAGHRQLQHDDRGPGAARRRRDRRGHGRRHRRRGQRRKPERRSRSGPAAAPSRGGATVKLAQLSSKRTQSAERENTLQGWKPGDPRA